MRLCKRNLRPVWYQLYLGEVPVVGEDGNETGEKKVSYAKPVKLECNISPAEGFVNMETFGPLENYHKIIYIEDMDCPVTDTTLFFVDEEPQYKEGELANRPDHRVYRIAKNLNHLAIAVKKVENNG